jgi:hypothetical protein
VIVTVYRVNIKTHAPELGFQIAEFQGPVS